jgi:hypothetical protein
MLTGLSRISSASPQQWWVGIIQLGTDRFLLQTIYFVRKSVIPFLVLRR